MNPGLAGPIKVLNQLHAENRITFEKGTDLAYRVGTVDALRTVIDSLKGSSSDSVKILLEALNLREYELTDAVARDMFLITVDGVDND